MDVNNLKVDIFNGTERTRVKGLGEQRTCVTNLTIVWIILISKKRHDINNTSTFYQHNLEPMILWWICYFKDGLVKPSNIYQILKYARESLFVSSWNEVMVNWKSTTSLKNHLRRKLWTKLEDNRLVVGYYSNQPEFLL